MPTTRKRTWGVLFAFLLLGALLSAVVPQQAWAADVQTMYRLYNRYTGEHFYTASIKERNSLTRVGWDDEGTGWTAPVKSKTPVYRLYNPYVTGGDHHYTTSVNEYNKLKQAGWRQEGIGWYSDDAKGAPLYRQYNPYAVTGTHNYTTSKKENDHLRSVGWSEEGIGWYGVKTEGFSYEVYYVDNRGTTWYSDTARTLYIKTDNPITSFYMKSSDSKVYAAHSVLSADSFVDVQPQEVVLGFLKVPGGYLGRWELQGDSYGSKKLQLVEQRSDGSNVVVRELPITYVNYDSAVNQWIDKKIAQYSNSSMNPVQKMDKISWGLYKEFKYMPTYKDGNGYLYFASKPNSPFFVSGVWESYTSPAILCKIAERVGGFTDIHNCYNDYPVGSQEWSSTHWYMTAKYNGKTYKFQACPLRSTNYVERGSVKPIDFTNVSQFQKAS